MLVPVASKSTASCCCGVSAQSGFSLSAFVGFCSMVSPCVCLWRSVVIAPLPPVLDDAPHLGAGLGVQRVEPGAGFEDGRVAHNLPDCALRLKPFRDVGEQL